MTSTSTYFPKVSSTSYYYRYNGLYASGKESKDSLFINNYFLLVDDSYYNWTINTNANT